MKLKTKFLITAISIAVISVTMSTSFPTEGKTVSVIEPNHAHIASAHCLALNIYHEARDQGTAGIFGVTAVVLNRVNDGRFPNTICEVVYQGFLDTFFCYEEYHFSHRNTKKTGIYFLQDNISFRQLVNF